MVAPAIEKTFVSLISPTGRREGAGGHPCQGVWYAPGGNPPKLALIATHYDIDFSEHYLAELVAARGLGFLGWNTRFRGAGAWFLLEHAVVDIGAGVRWLREVAGAEKVVLLGNSGGASLMSAYQSQALEPSIRPARGLQLPDAVLELPPADAFVSLNAHPGRPDVLTAWMDPSVTDENDPLSVHQTLDMYDESNGPPYAGGFIERYRRAQHERNEKISVWAMAELDRLSSRKAPDRLFNVHRVWADLRFLDLAIDPSDREPGCYLGDPRRANYGPFGIARTSTLRSWLSMWSLEHSQCRAAPHLGRIREPALVVQSTADQGCYPSDAQAIVDALGSARKRLELVPGDHYLYGNREQIADLIAEWVRQTV